MKRGSPGWREGSCAALLAVLLLVAAPARARCDIKQMDIPVRMVDQRPVATLTLNGTPVPMLVDSGAFFSFLNASTATQLNLPLGSLPYGLRIEGHAGRVQARMTRVAKVGLQGAELSNVEFVVGGNEIGNGIMGILGRNFLSMADAEYDLAHGIVRLVFPDGDCEQANFAYWAGDAPVVVAPLRADNRGDRSIRTEVLINGTRVTALLDTGAWQSTLTLKTAGRVGIAESDLTPAGRTAGAGEGLAHSWTGTVASFELGGERVSNNRLRFDDVDATDHGMLLGVDYFLSHRIYVSRLQQRAYITWNGDAVFALNRPEPGRYDTRYAAMPADVPRDDADALARRGTAAMAARDFKRALEDLDRACELAPGVAEYFHARARLHLELHEGRLALADLDEALRLDPALSEARFRRAWLNAGRGERAAAQTDLAALDAGLPPSAALRAEMGHLYASFDQAPEALRQFDLWVEAHRRDIRLAGVLNERCWTRARLNIDLPLALRDCKDAIDLDEEAPGYRDSLGWTYLRLGDAARAKKSFDAAIGLKEQPASLYGRGLAQRRLNDAPGGERDLAAARKLNPRIDDEVRKLGFDFADGAPPAAAAGS